MFHFIRPLVFGIWHEVDFSIISDSKSLTSWRVNANYLRYVTSGEMDRISVVCWFFFAIALGSRHDWNGYSVVVSVT